MMFTPCLHYSDFKSTPVTKVLTKKKTILFVSGCFLKMTNNRQSIEEVMGVNTVFIGLGLLL